MSSFLRHLGSLVASTIMALPAMPLPAHAQIQGRDPTPEEIVGMMLVDVPLVLDAIDPAVQAGHLWVKGDQPTETLLARFTMKPVQVAQIDGGSAGGQDAALLWRAFTGGNTQHLRRNILPLDHGERVFCGNEGKTIRCFADKDGDERFDHSGLASRERGPKPYHATIIARFDPLPKPLAYRMLGDDARPAIPVELRNCGRDHDRPRFTALSTVDEDIRPARDFRTYDAKDSTFAACRRGTRLSGLPASGGAPVVTPQGGYAAGIGPLAFAVGPKKDATLTLAGVQDENALYRLEGANLVDLRVGRTPLQAKIAALQLFPYPMLMTQAGATIHDGSLATGGVLARIPFRHAYRGRLTADVTVRTLLSQRSLPAGTVVYGFPSRASVTHTVNGIPAFNAVADATYRSINVALSWCAPLQVVNEENPAKVRKKANPGGTARNGWSAACLPHNATVPGVMASHTIITDRAPAFAVDRLTYDANTVTNPGPAPVERTDAAVFAEPLVMETVFQGLSADYISLATRIYHGSELTSETVESVYAPGGTVSVTMAGVPVELTITETGLAVKPASQPVTGANPVLEWDPTAMYMKAIENFQKSQKR